MSGLLVHQPIALGFWLVPFLALVLAWLACFPNQAKVDLWWMALGYHAVGLSWLTHVMILYAGWPRYIAVLMLLLFAAIMSLFWWLKGCWWQYCFRHHKPGFILLIASGWLLIDVLQSYLATGFPWLFPVFGWVHDPIYSGYLPVLGTWGCDLLVVVTAYAFLKLCQQYQFYRDWLIVLGIGIVGYGLGQYHWAADNEQIIPIRLVQGSVPQELRWSEQGINLAIERYVSLSQTALQSPPGLLLWGEGAIPLDQQTLHPLLQSLLSYSKKPESWGIMLGTFGADHQHPEQFYNQIVGFGQAKGLYRKRHLVPFGEYWPSWLNRLRIRLGLPEAMMAAGKAAPALVFRGQHAWAWICYELLFEGLSVPDSQQLVNWLLVVSNDAWFGNSIGPWQHLELAQWRALALSRWMVVATNNGISAIINPKGQIIKQLDLDRQSILISSIPGRKGLTPIRCYPVWSWPMLALLFICLMRIWTPAGSVSHNVE